MCVGYVGSWFTVCAVCYFVANYTTTTTLSIDMYRDNVTMKFIQITHRKCLCDKDIAFVVACLVVCGVYSNV